MFEVVSLPKRGISICGILQASLNPLFHSLQARPAKFLSALVDPCIMCGASVDQSEMAMGKTLQ